MSERGKETRWGRVVLLGGVAGFLPVPLVLVGAQLWAELAGASQAQAQLILARTGLLVGLGGGAFLALGAGWWVGRMVDRSPVGHGVVVGSVAALVGAGLVLVFGAPLTVPIVLAWLVRPPAGALGGWLGGRRRSEFSSEASPGWSRRDGVLPD